MPYMFEYSNGQPRVRWPELQRLELEPALRILGDTIERFLHGVMEGSTGGILLHDDVHHTLVNVAADNGAQAEAQETADEAHGHFTNVNIKLAQQTLDTENGGAVYEAEIRTPDFDFVARQPPLHSENVIMMAMPNRYPDWSLIHGWRGEGIHKRIAQFVILRT